MTNIEEITPEDSVVPVHLDTTPLVPNNEPAPADVPDPTEQGRKAAVEYFISTGMPEDVARAAVGYFGPLDP